jgi:hypothetical protein
LRRQLAQYQERQVKPRRANDATRIALVWLSRFFDWQKALVMVQPGHPHPLAPTGLLLVLALAIQARKTYPAQ